MSYLKGYRGQFIKIKTAKKRKVSSTRWLKRQLNDPFVHKSRIDGYRSRSAYKLIEINDRYKILQPGVNVLDLGAAPGGWSQVAAQIIKSDMNESTNKLIAVDLLPIQDIKGVITLEKNFYSSDTKNLIVNLLNTKLVEVVISDMSANTTGHKTTDHLRIMNLCESALMFALKILRPGGHFVSKVFKGGAEYDFLKLMKRNFTKVEHFKPTSSRKESSEFYIIGIKRRVISLEL